MNYKLTSDEKWKGVVISIEMGSKEKYPKKLAHYAYASEKFILCWAFFVLLVEQNFQFALYVCKQYFVE